MNNPISATELPDDIKSAICTVKVTMKNIKHEFVVKDDLNIDYENMETEMEQLPNIFHMWAMLYSEVREQKEVIEKKIKKRRGVLYKEIAEQGGKDLRRSDMVDIMETDELLENLEIKNILISKQSQKLWYILESIKMKNDNMRSLSGFKKQEMYQAGQSV
jgi:hypothetical protein